MPFRTSRRLDDTEFFIRHTSSRSTTTVVVCWLPRHLYARVSAYSNQRIFGDVRRTVVYATPRSRSSPTAKPQRTACRGSRRWKACTLWQRYFSFFSSRQRHLTSLLAHSTTNTQQDAIEAHMIFSIITTCATITTTVAWSQAPPSRPLLCTSPRSYAK